MAILANEEGGKTLAIALAGVLVFVGELVGPLGPWGACVTCVSGAAAWMAVCVTGEAACVTVSRSAAGAWPARTSEAVTHVKVQPMRRMAVRADARARVKGC